MPTTATGSVTSAREARAAAVGRAHPLIRQRENVVELRTLGAKRVATSPGDLHQCLADPEPPIKLMTSGLARPRLPPDVSARVDRRQSPDNIAPVPIRCLSQARHCVEVEERVIILDRANEDVEDRRPKRGVRLGLTDQCTQLSEPLRAHGQDWILQQLERRLIALARSRSSVGRQG